MIDTSRAVLDADTLPPDVFGRRVLSSVAWRGVSRFFVEISKVAVLVVLAHRLSPGDFGVAAEVMVVAGLVTIFSGLGLGAGLIQKHSPDELDWSTAFWAGLAISVAATLAGIALSGQIARFFGQPEVKPLFRAYSLVFLIGGLTTVQTQKLIRKLNYRALEIRTMVGTAAGAAAAVAAALLGWGAWAIILQQLVASGVMTLLLWRLSHWRPMWRFSGRRLRELSGFGVNVSGTLLLGELTRNADNVLIGRFLGATSLGAYSMAYTVMLLPFSRLTAPLVDVLYSAFARVREDIDLVWTTWIRANRLIAAISVPLLVGLAITAPDFVHLILGDKWNRAVHVLEILCWVGLLQSLQGLNASVLQARDRTHVQLRFGAVSCALNVAAFIGGLHWGIIGVAVAFSLSMTLTHPAYVWLTVSAVGRKPLDFYRSLRGVFAAAVGMAIVVFAARILMAMGGVSAAYRLAVAVVLGGGAYVGLCMWRVPEILSDLRRLRPRGEATVAVQTATPRSDS